MKVLDTTKISDDIWEEYLDFEKEILVKNDSKRKLPFSNGREFKSSNLERYKALETSQYIEYLLIDEKKVIGRFDAGVDLNNLSFGFVTIYDVLPEAILRIILNCVFDRMLKVNLDESYCWSYKENVNELIIRIGAFKAEELLLSRFEREKADIERFKRWITDIELNLKYKIIFYKNLPEEVLDKYVRFVNPIFKDIDALNPYLNKILLSIR